MAVVVVVDAAAPGKRQRQPQLGVFVDAVEDGVWVEALLL